MRILYTFLLAAFFLLQAQTNLAASDFNNKLKTNLLTVTPTFNVVSSICAGDFLAALPTTSLNGITGSWSPAVNNTVTTLYTFTPTAGQDATTVSIVITVKPIPSVPALTIIQPSCTADNGAVIITGVPEETYSFDGGPYASTLVYSGLSPGSSHTVRAQNGEGCFSSVVNITINAQPVTPSAPILIATQPTCTTSTGTISITGVAGQTYSVDGGPYSAALTYPGLSSGVHWVAAINAAGCISPVSTININPQPPIPLPPTITMTYQSCSSATITITGVIGETYSLDGSAYSSSLTYSGIPFGFHGLTARNAYGCTSTTNVFISTPTISFPSGITVCQGSTPPTLSTTFPNGITGTWSPATVSNTSNGSYIFTPSAVFSSCVSPFTTVATVVQQLNAGIDGSVFICDNSAASINLSSIITGEQLGGTWTRTSGIGGTFNAAAGTYTSAPGATTSTFSYTLTGTAPCVSDTSTATVVTNAAPNAGTSSASFAVCDSNPTPINLFDLITGEQPGGVWTRNPGSTGGTFNAATGVFVPGPGATTSSFTYTVAGIAPCVSANSTATITINAAPNAGTLSGNQTICVGSTTAFSATASGGTWTSLDPSIASVNALTGVVTGNSAGNTNITYTLAGTAPCPDVFIFRSVTVNALPNSGILSGNQQVCVGQTTTFSSTASGGIWSSANPAIATISSSGTITGVNAGTTTITYAVTGSGGCSGAVATRTITVNTAGEFNLHCDPSQATTLNSVFFDWSNIVGITSFQYSYHIANGPTVTGTTTISHFEVTGVAPGQSVTFEVTGVGSVSCTPSASMTCTLPFLAADYLWKDDFTFYPNPVIDRLKLEYSQPITAVEIFNSLGQSVLHRVFNSDKVEMDLSAFASGIYLAKVNFGNASQNFKLSKK